MSQVFDCRRSQLTFLSIYLWRRLCRHLYCFTMDCVCNQCRFWTCQKPKWAVAWWQTVNGQTHLVQDLHRWQACPAAMFFTQMGRQHSKIPELMTSNFLAWQGSMTSNWEDLMARIERGDTDMTPKSQCKTSHKCMNNCKDSLLWTPTL